jgi:hypothetical protein
MNCMGWRCQGFSAEEALSEACSKQFCHILIVDDRPRDYAGMLPLKEIL